MVLTRTAILLFYPTLPIRPDLHSDAAKAADNAREAIKFRSIPSELPSPSELRQIDADDETKQWERGRCKQSYALTFDHNFIMHLKHHYNLNLHLKDTEKEQAAARSLQDEQLHGMHTHTEHDRVGDTNIKSTEMDNRRIIRGENGSSPQTTERRNSDKRHIDRTTFVHLFASPLFQMAAANWARLIVRRSFDLDLLEWRPKNRVTSRTIDEIKSRRVAITRHQRDVNSSLEVLRGLMLEELGQQLRPEDLKTSNRLEIAQILNLAEGMATWNRGRCNGLVAAEANEDSWEKIFWDFFEIKASLAALEKRADKIQDGLVGLIQVTNIEGSDTLNKGAFLFSLILLPFSITGAIYSANLTTKQAQDLNGRPSHYWRAFVLATCVTFLGVLVAFILLWFGREYSDRIHKWLFRIHKIWKERYHGKVMVGRKVSGTAQV